MLLLSGYGDHRELHVLTHACPPRRSSDLIAACGIFLSAAAKSGQVPFSPWLFRAMAGPTSVSALLHAAAMVAAGAYLLARLHPMLGHAPAFADRKSTRLNSSH